jgi:hypothetical protein
VNLIFVVVVAVAVAAAGNDIVVYQKKKRRSREDERKNILYRITCSLSSRISGTKRTLRAIVLEEFSGDLIIRIGFFVLLVAMILFSDFDV